MLSLLKLANQQSVTPEEEVNFILFMWSRKMEIFGPFFDSLSELGNERTWQAQSQFV